MMPRKSNYLCVLSASSERGEWVVNQGDFRNDKTWITLYSGTRQGKGID